MLSWPRGKTKPVFSQKEKDLRKLRVSNCRTGFFHVAELGNRLNRAVCPALLVHITGRVEHFQRVLKFVCISRLLAGDLKMALLV